MAAGLGFKDFTTGEVLTAADVDGYLMQGIWVFASAAARDAAVTSPQEGNACYLKDTNQVLTYSGSAWVAVGGGSPLTTKGDVYGFSTVDARIPVGANNTVLTADSTQALGVKWAAAASGFSSAGSFVDRGSGTGESTTSSSYVDLTTTQAVTLTTGTKAAVFLGVNWAGDVNTANANFSFKVSGATTRAASNDNSLWTRSLVSGVLVNSGGVLYVSGLTAGSNTFTLQFNSRSGNTLTAYYTNIVVIDMGS